MIIFFRSWLRTDFSYANLLLHKLKIIMQIFVILANKSGEGLMDAPHVLGSSEEQIVDSPDAIFDAGSFVIACLAPISIYPR